MPALQLLARIVKNPWFYFGLPFAFVIIACPSFYFFLRHKSLHDLEIYGNIGTAFGILGAAFAGLAFCGLLVTFRLQRQQIQSTLNDVEVNSNFQTLASLQVRVGELIGDATTEQINFRREWPSARAFIMDYCKSTNPPDSDDTFLAHIASFISPTNISVSDAFRCKFVFSTLDSFFARVPTDQTDMLKGMLLAQLHDDAVRSLVLKALATKDKGLLQIYATLGLNVAVLNEFQNDLCPELARRFGFRDYRV